MDEENAAATNSLESSPRHGMHCDIRVVIVASILFLVLFFFATLCSAVDNARSRSMIWIVFSALHVVLPSLFLIAFYSLHCFLSALFVFHYFYLCLPEKFLFSLAGSLFVWSTILMITASVKTSNTEWADEREEHLMEALGGGFGMLSALYHFGMVKLLCRQKADE